MTPVFRSRRERRLWLWSGALLAVIYASLYSVRPLAEWLRERNLLRGTILLLFLVVAALILRWFLARAPGWREVAVLALFGVLYLVVLWPVRMPEERVHLLQYGLIAGLVYAAVLERQLPGGAMRWSPGRAAVAVLLTGLAGWGDEGIQYLLPNRHFDWFDVGLNLLAAVLGVGSLAALAEARRRSQRATR